MAAGSEALMVDEVGGAGEGPERQVVILGTMVAGLSAALLSCLAELARHYDNRPGRWLDDLQDRFVADVRNAATLSSGDIDPKAAEAAMAMIEHVCSDFRQQFSCDRVQLN